MLRNALTDGIGLMYGLFLGAVVTAGCFLVRDAHRESEEREEPARLSKDESDRMRRDWLDATERAANLQWRLHSANATIDSQWAVLIHLARERHPDRVTTVFPDLPRLGDAPEDRIPVPTEPFPTGRE